MSGPAGRARLAAIHTPGLSHSPHSDRAMTPAGPEPIYEELMARGGAAMRYPWSNPTCWYCLNGLHDLCIPKYCLCIHQAILGRMDIAISQYRELPVMPPPSPGLYEVAGPVNPREFL